jgi:hypothetical protein
MTKTRALIRLIDELDPLLEEFDELDAQVSEAEERENAGQDLVSPDLYAARDDAGVAIARLTRALGAAAMAAVVRPPIFQAEGTDARNLLRELGVPEGTSLDYVYSVRVTLHGGIMVKINEGGWTQPYGAE